MMNERLKIGISACFLYPDPARNAFAKKTLQYLEQSVPHWVMAGGAMPVMVPSPVGGTTGARDFHAPAGGVGVADYAQWLDGLVLHGGADLWPGTYREAPMDARWLGDQGRDDYEIALMRAFVAAGKPVFGICRGMQLINVAYGGTLVQDIALQRPDARLHRDADLYDQNFHQVELVPATRLASLLATPGAGGRKINSVHHQCIKDLAPGFIVEARCPDDNTIEAIRHTGADWVAGVQWHPEFHRAEYETMDDSAIRQDFFDAARAGRTQPGGATLSPR